MKKLSKMVLLLGSVFLLTLFASCSNGSSSDSNDSREPDTLLAGKAFYQERNQCTVTFCEDGKSCIYEQEGQSWEGSYYVEDYKEDKKVVYITYPEFSEGDVFYIEQLDAVGPNPDSNGKLQYIVDQRYENSETWEDVFSLI